VIMRLDGFVLGSESVWVTGHSFKPSHRTGSECIITNRVMNLGCAIAIIVFDEFIRTVKSYNLAKRHHQSYLR